MSDYEILMWTIGLMPLIASVTAVALMLSAKAKEPPVVWHEGERHLSEREPDWKPAHRAGRARPAPGRHEPARGDRLKGLSRQAQLEETTVYVRAPWALQERTEAWERTPCEDHRPFRDGLRIRCRSCLLDLPEPEDWPNLGGAGFKSWA